MKKIAIVAAVFLYACSAKYATSTTTNSAANWTDSISVKGKLFTSLYQQKAAEYRALCFQAFNIARLRLDNYQSTNTKPRAIITDIDETVLDNSPYAVTQAFQGKEYDSDSWMYWTSLGKADTVPGAVSFLQYAASRGVEIFYITNRKEKEREGTLKNLRDFGFPYADTLHYIGRKDVSSKESRRQVVRNTHEVVMLLGDNLGDFSSLFDDKTYEDRLTNTNLSESDFGSRFIVLPNPNYGDWEPAIYRKKGGLPQQYKDSVMRATLKRVQ